MKIENVWSIHYENFIIQVSATNEELKEFREDLNNKFPNKNFVINNLKGGNE